MLICCQIQNVLPLNKLKVALITNDRIIHLLSDGEEREVINTGRINTEQKLVKTLADHANIELTSVCPFPTHHIIPTYALTEHISG